nr:phage tail length tape measure family protein [Escherichia coli]
MSVARVAAGGGVAVLAALAAAAWQAEQADRALLRSLILTGGAAATTTAELWKMAGVISDEAGGGIRQAAENLARLAESGKIYRRAATDHGGNLSEMAADGGGRCREGGKSL